MRAKKTVEYRHEYRRPPATVWELDRAFSSLKDAKQHVRFAQRYAPAENEQRIVRVTTTTTVEVLTTEPKGGTT